MFDIGWGEFLVIGIVALIAIGPKELPGVLRSVGQWMGKIRHMASEFQGHFQEAMREAEMADLKKDVDEMTAAAYGIAKYDPLETVRKEMDAAMDDRTETPPLPVPTGSPAAEPAPPVQTHTQVIAPAPAPAEKTEVPAETPRPAEGQRG